ncbi:hypothetical protein ACFQPA_21850 [Halomarina halobia]|uniref:hypothetical protein n=1 Tax=Halomarina halobia TaxID=3033386 RepID=UPI0023E7F79A|nr:hypothetical protein [Halomarina sp. PSR21]
MTRRSKRGLEKRLDQLEDQSEQTPELCLVYTPLSVSDPLSTAIQTDWHAQCARGNAPGFLIMTSGVIAEFRGRLSRALYDLRAETGVYIPQPTFLEFLHGRVEGDVPLGDEGVRAFFEQAAITADHVDRVWDRTVMAASPDYPAYGPLAGASGHDSDRSIVEGGA